MVENVRATPNYDELNDSIVITRIVKGVKTQVVVDNLLKIKVSKLETLGDYLKRLEDENEMMKRDQLALSKKLDESLVIQKQLAQALSLTQDTVKLINDKLSLEGRL